MKIILTIILTTVVVLFSIQNFDHVPLNFFAGKAIQIRLIFVISIAGIAGYLLRYLIGIQREEEIKKKYRMLRLRDKEEIHRTYETDEEDF